MESTMLIGNGPNQQTDRGSCQEKKSNLHHRWDYSNFKAVIKNFCYSSTAIVKYRTSLQILKAILKAQSLEVSLPSTPKVRSLARCLGYVAFTSHSKQAIW